MIFAHVLQGHSTSIIEKSLLCAWISNKKVIKTINQRTTIKLISDHV